MLTLIGNNQRIIGPPEELHSHIECEYSHLTGKLPSVKDYMEGFKFMVEWTHMDENYSEYWEVHKPDKEDMIWREAYDAGFA